MSHPVTVLGSAEDVSLAGAPDSSPAGPPDGALPVIALGEHGVPGGSPAVRWLERAPDREYPERVIAPTGDGLWRVAPWPAADALFDLPRLPGGVVVVSGAEAHLRHAIATGAAARGLDVHVADKLDAERLREAACVVIAESPQRAVPARVFPVLAAGRLLLVPRLGRSFGLEDGLDHLEFAGPDEAVTLLEAHARNPAAFERVCAWARVKARPQRASVVYSRLAGELRPGVA